MKAAALGREVEVAVTLVLVRAWRLRRPGQDDDLQRRMALACRSRCAGRFAVVAAVCRYGRNHAFSRPGQGRHLGRVAGMPFGQHVVAAPAAIIKAAS